MGLEDNKRLNQEPRGKFVDSSEFKAYSDELFKRLDVHLDLAASIPAEQPGSVEWLDRIGEFWRKAREQSGVSRNAIADQIGIPLNSVRFLEVGLGYPELGLIQEGKVNPSAALESDIHRRYAEALGHPELLQQFQEQFSMPRTAPGTSR